MQGFGGETWEKRQVLGPRRGWKNNIKMDFQRSKGQMYVKTQVVY